MIVRLALLLLTLMVALGSTARAQPPGAPPQWLVAATQTAEGLLGVTSAQGMLRGQESHFILMRTAKKWPCSQKAALWGKVEAAAQIITPEPCLCWKISEFQGTLPAPNKSIVNFRISGLPQYDDELAQLALQTISAYKAVEIWRPDPAPVPPMDGVFAASRPLGFNCGATVEAQLEELQAAIEGSGLPVELFDMARNCYGNWVGPLLGPAYPPPFRYAHLCLVGPVPS